MGWSPAKIASFVIDSSVRTDRNHGRRMCSVASSDDVFESVRPRASGWFPLDDQLQYHHSRSEFVRDAIRERLRRE